MRQGKRAPAVPPGMGACARRRGGRSGHRCGPHGGDRRWKAPLLTNIGYELKVLGRYDEALDYFEQALVAYEERGDKDAIRVAHWMIANTLRMLRKFDAALAIQLRLEKEFAPAERVDAYVLEKIAALYGIARGSRQGKVLL